MTFTREDIVQRLKSRPFRPFKLRLQNGRIFNVRASDDLWVGLSGFLAFDSGRDDFSVSDVRAVVGLEARRGTKSSH